METIEKLIELFKEFPGIGPRQAKRFVYFLLAKNSGYRENVSRAIAELKNNIEMCRSCFRFFPQGKNRTKECSICSDPNRENSSLMIVSRDVDYENIEKSHSYNGKYFILGGSVPILEKMPEDRIRIKDLIRTVKERAEKLKEIIMALNVTPEGENTEDYIESSLSALSEKYHIKISTLGRGLSTGLELEYSDSETIKNALKNRS
jgi:recombination protein RecR